jgi:hypothetical protein
MVLIFSGNANASAQVHCEVDQAFRKGKAVLPLRIEDVRPADELAYLDTVHWLDALTPPLETNLEKLVATARALLPTTEQAEARAMDEGRLKEAEAAQRAEAEQRDNKAVEALRQKQEAEAQRLAAAPVNRGKTQNGAPTKPSGTGVRRRRPANAPTRSAAPARRKRSSAPRPNALLQKLDVGGVQDCARLERTARVFRRFSVHPDGCADLERCHRSSPANIPGRLHSSGSFVPRWEARCDLGRSCSARRL